MTWSFILSVVACSQLSEFAESHRCSESPRIRFLKGEVTKLSIASHRQQRHLIEESIWELSETLSTDKAVLMIELPIAVHDPLRGIKASLAALTHRICEGIRHITEEEKVESQNTDNVIDIKWTCIHQKSNISVTNIRKFLLVFHPFLHEEVQWK